MSGAQMRCNRLGSLGDVAQVGFVIFVERGWDANDDRIHLGQTRIVRGRAETLGFRRLNLIRRDADNVGAALIQRRNLAGVDVETGNREPLVAV